MHGYKGKALIGEDFQVTEFNLSWQVADEDITHTGATGFQVVLDGIRVI